MSLSPATVAAGHYVVGDGASALATVFRASIYSCSQYTLDIDGIERFNWQLRQSNYTHLEPGSRRDDRLQFLCTDERHVQQSDFYV